MDKLGARKLNTKNAGKKAASANWRTGWRAAALFIVILVCVAALSLAVLNSGAKTRSAPAGTNFGNASAPAPPPKFNVDPFLPSGPEARRSCTLTNAFSSAEALARRLLTALASKDKQSIEALRISKDEFCHCVWPQLPSSRLPNVTCDWAWDQATLNSMSGLSEMMPAHSGKRLELVSLSFEGTDSYPTYRVHNKTTLMVRESNGSVKEIRVCGSMLEMNGQFKLFSFVID
ncbi:MAG TPA: hypothetical protein VLE20_06630 [Blastocatellia bacterium]|nr:hypothetical protein [Blastocatellia bacterium]